MKSITFFVPGLPKAQPRPRAYARHGIVRVYNPGTTDAWKKDIGHAWELAGGQQFIGPVMCTLAFKMPRPKSHICAMGVKESAPDWCVTKPDCDNLAKAVLDKLSLCGAWIDDSWVTILKVKKTYANETFLVGCEIYITELEEKSC